MQREFKSPVLRVKYDILCKNYFYEKKPSQNVSNIILFNNFIYIIYNFIFIKLFLYF